MANEASAGTDSGSQRLVAYAAPEQGQRVDAAVLKAHLKQKLPDYMIPAIFVILDALPLSPNGKVDRKALPEPDRNGLAFEAGYVAPGNTAQATLCHIWQNVLGLERIGVHDNFFELGGHSLLTARLIPRLREALGVELTLLKVFERQTVADLAALVESAIENGGHLPDGEEEAIRLEEALMMLEDF